MTSLTLTSSKQGPLRPLVEAAIENQLRLLEAGVERTEERIRAFEAEYGMSSETFVRRYENDELPETLSFAEWIGEHRMLSRLREKAETLREIRIAD